MNLPKYVPGMVVIIKEDEATTKEQILTYPEKIGMFVVAEAFIDHEEWHYTNYDRSIQMHEHEIQGVVNSGVFVPAERFHGVEDVAVVEKRQKDQEAKDEFVPKPTKEESKFIKEQFDKHQKEMKAKAKANGNKKRG